MNMDDRSTQISEPRPTSVEEMNISVGRTVTENSLYELGSIQTDDVNNVMVTIMNILLSSRDAKSMLKTHAVNRKAN